MSVVSHASVVMPLIGVSSGFAGLTLVFLGLVVTAYRSYTADVPATVRKPYRVDGACVLGAFLLGVVAVVVDASWLLAGGRDDTAYATLVTLFFVQLAALVGAALRVVWRALWAA